MKAAHARSILISGMGIAGPTLAAWLRLYGFEPTIVERSPRPRAGGYIIDFWGKGFDVADKMGLLPRLRELGYFVREVRLVNSSGRKSGGFSADVFRKATNNRYVSIPRGDLAESLRSAVFDSDVIWNDTIERLDFRPDHVDVQLKRAGLRSFDLVIGADGLHSNMRRLLFGAETQYERYLGYKVAVFEADGYPHRDENVYVSFAAPGRQIARFSMRHDKTMFLLVFRDRDPALPADRAACRQALHHQFDDCGWESAEILAAMDQCPDLYFDRVSQIRMPVWVSGRGALVGDAAYAPSLLAGEGAALAVIGSYVLAGELALADGDFQVAFERYEVRLQRFILKKQTAAEGFASSFAPRTQLGILIRNLVTRAFALPIVADIALGASVKDDLSLPDYPGLLGHRAASVPIAMGGLAFSEH